MIRIELHVPGFIEVGDGFRYGYQAATWEELVRTERLARWASDPAFDYWCISDNCLMAQMKPRGEERGLFWVVAYIREGQELLNLPAWIPPPER